MITLQNFIAPDPEICTEQPLYGHVRGDYGLRQSDKSYVLTSGTHLSFDSYFNLFNLNTWAQHARLDSLLAELRGKGKVALRVTHVRRFQSWEVVHSDVVDLDPETPYLIDLSHMADGTHRGLLYVTLTALDDEVEFHGGRFATKALPADCTLPRLTISITTFKREEEVRRTAERLETFLQDFAYGDQLRVQVVDNGQSAKVPKTPHVTPMENANLGGAGGFARGLLEAEAAGSSHCLFMDDDASFDMENILRAYMFLTLARAENAAVSGAMITNATKFQMWENGAVFNGFCRGLYNGTDLRNARAVIDMELEVNTNPAPTLYGGWWFFAFPIAKVTHHPFPFFVRGDDINFSQCNDFKICTINGVVSFQDDFIEKENAQTLYLDMRSCMVQHLTVPHLDRSALKLIRLAMFFVIRSCLRLHYATAHVQMLAWEDVMEGPDFFDRNIDMSARRAKIKEMGQEENWRPARGEDLHENRRGIAAIKKHLPRHYWGLYTVNGHLWPFYRSSTLVLQIHQRTSAFEAFGARNVTYINTEGDMIYTVTRSRRRFFGCMWKMAKLSWRLYRNHAAIKAAYRKGHDRFTTKAYWQETLAAHAPAGPQAEATRAEDNRSAAE